MWHVPKYLDTYLDIRIDKYLGKHFTVLHYLQKTNSLISQSRLPVLLMYLPEGEKAFSIASE